MSKVFPDNDKHLSGDEAAKEREFPLIQLTRDYEEHLLKGDFFAVVSDDPKAPGVIAEDTDGVNYYIPRDAFIPYIPEESSYKYTRGVTYEEGVRRVDMTFPAQDKPGPSPLDTQVGGDHYKDYEIQPLEFIYRNKIPAVESNIIKYVVRHKRKNGLQDLQKALHYLQFLIKNEYGS